MNKPIINLNYGQKELAVRLVQPGCDGGQLLSHESIQLVIFAPNCGYLLKSPIIMKGCHPGNPYRNPPDPRNLPVLHCPALRTDEKGRIVFRLDHRFDEYPPGCYVGSVQFKNGHPICDLDIRFHTTPLIIDEVEVITPGPKRPRC